MKSFIYIFILLISFTLSSCEAIFLDKGLESGSKKDNFEYLWSEIDKKYSFFDLKGVDWNAVKTKYQSQVKEEMTDEEFFNVMASMMNELKDDHSNLISPFNTSNYNVARNDPAQIHTPLLVKLFPDLATTGNLSHTWIPNQNIAYIRFPSFQNLTAEQYDYVLERYKNSKGIILDIRSNPGGAGVLVNLLLSRLVNKKTTVGYEQMRNGPKHDDFSEPAAAIIEPKGHYYSGKVAVLIDRRSYSSSTYFSLATKALNNVTLIGDTTGGGAGMPNGGELPNGWTYRFSITRFLDLNKSNYAENGVPPAIKVNFDWTNLNKDEIIDAAVDFLNK